MLPASGRVSLSPVPGRQLDLSPSEEMGWVRQNKILLGSSGTRACWSSRPRLGHRDTLPFASIRAVALSASPMPALRP